MRLHGLTRTLAERPWLVSCTLPRIGEIQGIHGYVQGTDSNVSPMLRPTGVRIHSQVRNFPEERLESSSDDPEAA